MSFDFLGLLAVVLVPLAAIVAAVYLVVALARRR
jgi:hypothetical protein